MLPGWLIALFTFPGVVVHEISHRFFAELFKIPVYDICYFRVPMGKNKFAGYVLIGKVEKAWHAFFIFMGPLLINSILCILIASPAIMYMHVLEKKSFFPIGFIAWLGISIGAHAIPSNKDISCFTDVFCNSQPRPVCLLFIMVLVSILRFANALSFFWIDFIYAIAISSIFPYLFGFSGWGM